MFRVAAELAGATVGDETPALTFCCRPGNPLGDLPPLPDARPLAVDEAYFEYAGESAVGLIDDGVVVIRTFSKAFALAGARIAGRQLNQIRVSRLGNINEKYRRQRWASANV